MSDGQPQQRSPLSWRGVAVVILVVVTVIGMTQAMTIRANAADVGGSTPPVAATYLLFLWSLAAGSLPAMLRRRLRLSRQDVTLGYCAALISGPIAHQYGVGFLVPHMVSVYYYDTGWQVLHRWLPWWFGPSDPAVVRSFFLGSGGDVPWSAWLVPGLAWSVLLGALFLVGHCAMVLLRQHWIGHERLAFPLAQIPLGIVVTDDGRRPALLSSPAFWTGLAVPLLFGAVRGLHRYIPSIPDIPLRPVAEYDFGALAPPPWRGLGLLEFHFSFWLVAIVVLLPAEISLSGWVFFWVTKLEDIAALAFGATDIPDVYTNRFPALYAQGAGAALAMVLLVLYGARHHLRRMLAAAWRGDRAPTEGEFASPRFAVAGLLAGLGLMIGWLWLAGMRLPIAGLLVALMLGYFVLFARIRAEAGLGMGVILWPKMLDEVMVTLVGSRGMRPAELTVLFAVRWLYFGPPIGGVMGAQMESLKISGEVGSRGRAVGGVLLGVALLTAPLAIAWTLHTYHERGFVNMRIGHPQLSMVGSQVYWSYSNLLGAINNPAPQDWSGISAMGVGGGVAFLLTWLRTRFLWWPLHPIGYMAANSWGMHWNWGALTVGWLVKVLLLRYGGLGAFRKAVPLLIGLVVGDMLSEGLWGGIAAWIAATPR